MSTETIRPGESRTYLDIADVAKLVRATLKEHFGKFPFSVKSKRYSGGSSITVYWTDGPTASRVDALIGHFCGATFDGMIDLKSYHDAETLIGKDGSVRHVHYGNDFIFTQRTISDWERKEKEATEYIMAHCVIDTVTSPGYPRFGNEWVSDCARRMIYAVDYTMSEPIDVAFRRGVLRESI